MKDNSSETVNKSRQFETLLSIKKSVKLIMPDTPVVNTLQIDSVQDILNGIETVEKVFAKQNVKLQGQRPEQTRICHTQQTALPPAQFNAGQRSLPNVSEPPRPQSVNINEHKL